MSLELVSFVICPFVQRAIIVLSEKEVPFEITYVDIDEPPEWFSKISPFGKVPLLKVDGDVLFESAIINEYLDEVFMPRLHPDAPLERAKQRGWIEFGSNLFFEQVGLLLAKNADEYQQKKEGLAGSFARLEQQLGDGPYFQGSHFSLLDAAYAPLFMRFDLLTRWDSTLAEIMPSRMQKWGEALLKRPSVMSSVVDDFDKQFVAFFAKKGSWLLGNESDSAAKGGSDYLSL
ncbi:MAG: glutathione S-transferase family protein [Candidatus Sedimenticola sp. (ex Thyasira tokunagai)]